MIEVKAFPKRFIFKQFEAFPFFDLSSLQFLGELRSLPFFVFVLCFCCVFCFVFVFRGKD